VGGHSTGGCGERISLEQCRLTLANNVGLCSYLSTSFSCNLVPLPTCISAHNFRYFTYRLTVALWFPIECDTVQCERSVTFFLGGGG
jgi:hypothetical protein